jgi:hypothetical protein
VDADPGVGEPLRHFGLDEKETPVVAFATQPLLRNPATRKWAETVGLKSQLGHKIYDLVVVGAGRAGLGAAVYAPSEGLNTVVLDAAGPGEQANASSRIKNYIGFPTDVSGAELTGRATLQAQKFGTLFSMPSPIIGLDREGPHRVVLLDDEERVSARCSIRILTPPRSNPLLKRPSPPRSRLAPDGRSHPSAEELDGAHDLLVRKRAGAELHEKAPVAENLILEEDLFDHLLRTVHEVGSAKGPRPLDLLPRHGGHPRSRPIPSIVAANGGNASPSATCCDVSTM